MEPTNTPHDSTTTGATANMAGPDAQVEDILTSLSPRMITAKRTYMKRRFGAMLVVPLLAGIGVARAANQPDVSISQVADGGGAAQIIEEEFFEDGGEDEGDEKVTEEDKADELVTESPDDKSSDEGSDEDLQWETVSLNFAGSVQVAQADDDTLVLGIFQLNDGWKADVFKDDGEELVIVLSAVKEGEASLMFLATVSFEEVDPESGEQLDERFSVVLDVIDAPDGDDTGQTPEGPADTDADEQDEKEEAAAEEKDKVEDSKAEDDKHDKVIDAVQNRKEIGVYDKATAVVERDGNQLWLDFTWVKGGWEPVLEIATGERVQGYVTAEGTRKYVEAWIDGNSIEYRTWYVEPEHDEGEHDKDKDDNDKDDNNEGESEVEYTKEISVFGKGQVVVNRDGDLLYLSVQWSHEWWDAVVVTGEGTLVQAYFTNDGVEKHVKAWIEGNSIVSQTWVVEAEVAPYSGTAFSEFGSYEVLVEGSVAQITSISPNEGVTYEIYQEAGEWVKVRFITGEGDWWVKAWGNGSGIDTQVYAA